MELIGHADRRQRVEALAVPTSPGLMQETQRTFPFSEANHLANQMPLARPNQSSLAAGPDTLDDGPFADSNTEQSTVGT